MKDIKSFYKGTIFLLLLVFCSLVIGQRMFVSRSLNDQNNGHVIDTSYGAFLVAQHALYINDFDTAVEMANKIDAKNTIVSQIKNTADFFNGKMPDDAKKLKDSKDFISSLIYDAYLIQKDDWKTVYNRHSKDESVLSAQLRIFSGAGANKGKETIKFINSLKIDDNWKSFVRGQIAVLNNDIDGAAKEFAHVHPAFMNINDYLYLMSFYQKNGMDEDMKILRNDFVATPAGMYVLKYPEIPDWSEFDGVKNHLVFSIIQNVSHNQFMMYTDLSLTFLRFAQIISENVNTDAINYYLGQYYVIRSGDYSKSFEQIQKSSPLYVFGKLKAAEKTNDIKTIEKIVHDNPLFIPALQIIVRENIKNGNRGHALSVINRALKQKGLPIDGKIYLLKQRTHTYLMFNDAQNAQKDLNSLQILEGKLVPDTMALQARAWTMENRNLDEAYKYAMSLVKINTADVGAWDILGMVVDKKEGTNNALELLERIGEVSTTTSSLYEHLGDMYKKVGDNERALRSYQRALDLSDDCLVVVPFIQKKIRNVK